MKSYSIFVITFALLTISSILSQTNNVKPEVIVGILLDGRWEGDKVALDELILQCSELLRGEFNINFPEDKIRSGDWELDKTNSNLLQLLNDPNVDIVIAYGEISSRLAVFTPDLPKPVIAPAAINAQLQGMPIKNGTSGVNNLNYLAFTSNLNNQIPAFKKLYEFKKAAMLINQNYYGSQEFIRDTIESRIERNIEGVEVEFVPVGFNYETILETVSPDVEAVIIQPVRFLSYQQIDDLISRFKDRGIPTFSIFDERYVSGEALAGFVPKNFFQRHSRRIALNIQAILLGENAADLPVSIPIDDEFIINMKTADELKIYPSWALMNNSKLINYVNKEVEREITLNGVIGNALVFNLDLLAEKKRIESGEQDVNIARSILLPQLNASATGTLIDKDRAENGFGQISEKMITGDLTLDQLVYDVDAWANYDINTMNQELREYELRQAELDLIRDASISYFNVFLARTVEQINKDNLILSKSNMELARYRVNVGSANLTELYRWQSEIANNLKAVIEANADKNLAEININQLLDLPAEESFSMGEDSLEQLISIVTGEKIIKYYKNKWDFKIFRDFMVQEAFENSPELKIIYKAIEIQERISTAASTQFYIPTFGLQGQVGNVFYRGGAGSEPQPITIPGVGDYQLGAIPKDFSWNVGLSLKLPLFEGAGRIAEVEQSAIEIKKLEYEQSSLKNKIEQLVRSALHQSGASYAGMLQAEISSQASSKNLSIVREMYSEGLASITDLLDAQNAVLIAELLSTSAQFNFLIDLMNVQRGIGEFIFTYDVDEREAFIIRLEEYFELNNKN
ncbi:MAG: TolC family protein [Ignavibacteriaceae bacterium]